MVEYRVVLNLLLEEMIIDYDTLHHLPFFLELKRLRLQFVGLAYTN